MSDITQQRVNQARALSQMESITAFISLHGISENLAMLSEVLELAHKSRTRLYSMRQLARFLDDQIWELGKVLETLCPEPEENN